MIGLNLFSQCSSAESVVRLPANMNYHANILHLPKAMQISSLFVLTCASRLIYRFFVAFKAFNLCFEIRAL